MNFKNFEQFEADYRKFMECDYIDFSEVKKEIDEKAACNLEFANSDFEFEERNSKGKIKLFYFNRQVKETKDGDFIYTYTYLG